MEEKLPNNLELDQCGNNDDEQDNDDASNLYPTRSRFLHATAEEAPVKPNNASRRKNEPDAESDCQRRSL